MSELRVGKGFVCEAGCFLGSGKVSDGPKLLVYCSNTIGGVLIPNM